MILEDLTTEEWLDLRYEEGREEGEKNRNKYFLSLIDQGLSVDEIKQHLKAEN